MDLHNKQSFEEHLKDIIELSAIDDQIRIKEAELRDLKAKYKEKKDKIHEFEKAVLSED